MLSKFLRSGSVTPASSYSILTLGGCYLLKTNLQLSIAYDFSLSSDDDSRWISCCNSSGLATIFPLCYFLKSSNHFRSLSRTIELATDDDLKVISSSSIISANVFFFFLASATIVIRGWFADPLSYFLLDYCVLCFYFFDFFVDDCEIIINGEWGSSAIPPRALFAGLVALLPAPGLPISLLSLSVRSYSSTSD